VSSVKFSLVNGGIFTVSLNRITPIFWHYFNEEDIKKTLPAIIPNITSIIIPWFIPKGEITFFKKPSQFLKLHIKTNKALYAPGDKVDFEVTCVNKSSGDPIENCFVSATVTDDSVYRQLSEMKQPPSLPARVYLEDEVKKSPSGELYYANEYIEQWWHPSDNKSSNEHVELLLGVQGWRFRILSLEKLQYFKDTDLANMTQTERDEIENLYGYKFYHPHVVV